MRIFQWTDRLNFSYRFMKSTVVRSYGGLILGIYADIIDSELTGKRVRVVKELRVLKISSRIAKILRSVVQFTS